MNATSIGIVGLGLMGEAIARASLKAGYRVKLHDVAPQTALEFQAQHPEVAERVEPVDNLVGFAGCDLIVEAITERLEPKLELLRQLDDAAPDVTIASNSSTFMPSEMAVALKDPSRLLVCHFFNPADVVPLVEIVPSEHTDPHRLQAVREFALAIGKSPVMLAKEIEGFVANRLQAAVLRECFSLIESGVADPETIDQVVRMSLGPRWAANGPIATADLGGLEVFEALMNRLSPRLNNGSEAPETIRRSVAAGRFGAKSGAGVHEWPEDRERAATERVRAHFALVQSSEASA